MNKWWHGKISNQDALIRFLKQRIVFTGNEDNRARQKSTNIPRLMILNDFNYY